MILVIHNKKVYRCISVSVSVVVSVSLEVLQQQVHHAGGQGRVWGF